jgi:DNA-binding CsgD family transcriptional regulator
MTALASSDAERLLRFVADAETLGGDQPFTGELLTELGRLIEGDWVTYHEVDHVRRRTLLYVARPGDEDDGADELEDHDWELISDHPICTRWRREGRFTALRLSDVATRSELRQSAYFATYFEPWGISHELKVRLPSPSWHARTFMFNRNAGRDFTKRDRLVLELLVPHLSRLWHATRMRRLLASALDALDSRPETDQRGIVLLGTGGEIEFASAPALRLLRAFPPAETGRLPAPLVDWLGSGSSDPIVRKTATGQVVVRRLDGTLLLEEQNGLELTTREREVLLWVSRGRTNAEIAELLWVAPSTVRKHLENVYAKLGVNTRTAAATRFLGLIDAEAS